MSWGLIRGCTLPSPISSWNRLRHPPHDPKRDIERKEEHTQVSALHVKYPYTSVYAHILTQPFYLCEDFHRSNASLP